MTAKGKRPSLNNIFERLGKDKSLGWTQFTAPV